jgi:hypothetical protein
VGRPLIYLDANVVIRLVEGNAATRAVRPATRLTAFRLNWRTGRLAREEDAMSQQSTFADILDAAEQLDVETQEELVSVLSRRLAERGRERVAATVAQARREFAAGQCRPMTAAEIVREAQS